MDYCLLCSEQINTFIESYYKTPNGSVCKKCGDELFAMTKGFELMNVYTPLVQRFSLTPVQIYKELNEYVIGQDDAKKSLSIATTTTGTEITYTLVLYDFDEVLRQVDASNNVSRFTEYLRARRASAAATLPLPSTSPRI